MKKLALLAAAAVTSFAAVAQMSVTPAPGQVSELSEFHITFNGAEWSLENRSAKFTVTGPEGVEIPPVYGYSLGTEGYMAYFADDAVITAPGDYVFTIPAGKFGVGGELNEETSYNYTIGGGGSQAEFPAYTLSPEAGDVEKITTITITFDTTEKVSADGSRMIITGPTSSYAVMAEADGSSVVLTPIDSYSSAIELTAMGAYELSVGAGALTVGGVSNPKGFKVEYTIGGDVEAWDGTYTANPASGSALEEISSVTITLEGVTNVAISDTAGPADFPKVYDISTGSAVSSCTTFASGNKLDISISPAITLPGEYRLVVPAAFYRANGRTTDVKMVVEYTIAGGSEGFEYTCTITPAASASIAADDSFVVEFAAEHLSDVTYDEFAWGTQAPHFDNDFGAYNPGLQIVKETATMFRLNHAFPFEETGDYELLIPAGYFTLVLDNGDSEPNKLIRHPFHVDLNGSAIRTLGADSPDVFDIYDTTGRLIMRNATPADLPNLPTGIYLTPAHQKLLK